MELRDLIEIAVRSQSDFARMEKEELKKRIEAVKKKIWTEIY